MRVPSLRAGSQRRNSLWLPIALLAAAFCLTGSWQPSVTAGEQPYPGEHWEQAPSPETVGYSSEKLALAQEYTQGIQTAAVMVVVDGLVLTEWGETKKSFKCHSIRKSFLSALYGIHVNAGTIDLSKTMVELGIDDNEPSVTEVEEQATVHQLLKARSGVYHPALYETEGMKARRPLRHSHAPGTFWYYNNWDFNVLGTLFRNLTKTDIFGEFGRSIAGPVGMQDFDVSGCRYVTGPDSVHAAYPFRMTARDMARFGLLFLRGGRWEGRQIIPSQWVKDSVTSYSDAGPSGGYGYLWWVAVEGRHFPNVSLGDGAYSARGAGGHRILVIPSHDMVIVHRVDTDVRGNSVSSEDFGTLVQMILDARM
jgi:CubicO group peptidase (beta-lactamase class C family)